jgi:hypothetical protein
MFYFVVHKSAYKVDKPERPVYFISTCRQSYFLGNQKMTSQRGQSQLTKPQASGIAVLHLDWIRQAKAASPPFKIAIDWQNDQRFKPDKSERPVKQPKGNSRLALQADKPERPERIRIAESAAFCARISYPLLLQQVARPDASMQ